MTKGVLRVLASGFPLPVQDWTPFVRLNVNLGPMEDVTMVPVEGAKDVYVATREDCTLDTLVIFELGMLAVKRPKGFTKYKMDSNIHKAVLTEDCIVLMQWDHYTRVINNMPGVTQTLVLNEGFHSKVRGSGVRRQLGMWRPESISKQLAKYIGQDVCVIPVPMMWSAVNTVELKLKDAGLDNEKPTPDDYFPEERNLCSPFQDTSISLATKSKRRTPSCGRIARRGGNGRPRKSLTESIATSPQRQQQQQSSPLESVIVGLSASGGHMVERPPADDNSTRPTLAKRMRRFFRSMGKCFRPPLAEE